MPPADTSGIASRPSIRLARPDERLALENLQRRASLALPDYRRQLQEHPDAIHLPQEQIDQGEVLVAEAGGEIAGFAAFIASDQSMEIDGLFVEPEHWRRGIGAALVEAAIHAARRRGLSLWVVAGPSARPFYECCGFSVEGDAKTTFGPAFRMSR